MSRKPQQGARGEGIIPDICSLKQKKCFSAAQVVKFKSALKSVAALCGVSEHAGHLSYYSS